MFESFKNIFSTKQPNNQVMTETTTVPNVEDVELVTKEVTPSIEEPPAPLSTQNPSADYLANVEPIEAVNNVSAIPTYEQLTSFNPREVYPSNEILLNSPEIVGWLSTQEQELLFSALLLFYSPEQSILDVGCGRADLYGYCKRMFGDEAKALPYKGIDYNPNILNIAQEKYPGVYTEAVDILNSPVTETHDWVVGSGLFNLLDNEDMERYTKTVIQKMYDKANMGVVFNLLTGYPDDMADEDVAQLVVHDPVAWLDYLLNTYTKVICRADYLSGDVTFYIFK